MNRTTVLLGVLGVLGVVAGVALWSVAAALVVAGLALLGAAWLSTDVADGDGA
jgi:hypothetical protein